MIYGITTSRKFNNSINERFSPVYDTNNLSYIYESMHSFGSADFLHNALHDFKEIVSDEIKNELNLSRKNKGIFLVNKSYTYFLDNIDYDFTIDVPEMIEYPVNNDWCDELTISAAVFAAKTLSDARKMFKDTFKYNGMFNCVSVENTAYICLFSLAYIDGEIVNIFNEISLEEGIYHELMHKYVNSFYKSLYCSKKTSPFVSATLRVLENHKKHNKLANNIYRLAYIIYALSKSEMSAHLAQNKERFNNENISSSKEFYDLLYSSQSYNILKIANNVIKFIDEYPNTNTKIDITFKKVFRHFKDIIKMNITSIDELVSLLIEEWNCNNLADFKKELIKRIDIFKHKLYNIAYDSVPDSVKHKITREYFSK